MLNSVIVQHLILCTLYVAYIQRWAECTTPQIHPKTPKDELSETEKGDLNSIAAQKNREEPPSYHEVEQSGIENHAFEKEQRTE